MDDPTRHLGVEEPISRLFADLRTGARGLTSREAARRLVAYGPNELRERAGRAWWRDVVDQLVHPLALLLWVAALLAAVIGAPVLALAIVVVILLNAALAFAQERQGEQAVQALRRYLPASASVLRDGHVRQVPATELVPGDVVLVNEGDRVSADGRLIDGAVELDTSPLTGEVLPVLREPGPAPAGTPPLEATDAVFSGTTCTGGQARAVVVHTGMQTEIGRIAALSQGVPREPSPLERQVRRVAWLIAVVAVLAGLAFVPIGVLVAGLSLHDAVNFAIGLLVANVPEGLLPTITLALAVGVRELARRGALVKRLSAVETLGSTSVVCTDKTGTLTRNQMSAIMAWSPGVGEIPLDGSGGGHGLRRLAGVLALCTSADLDDPAAPADPTDIGLLRAAGALGVRVPTADRQSGRLATFRFDPQRRLMTTVDTTADAAVDAAGDATVAAAAVHTKGAPEEVLRRSSRVLTPDGERPLDDDGRRAILDDLAPYAATGLRLIGAADRSLPAAAASGLAERHEGRVRDQVESDLTFLGVVALLDPPREGVAAAIADCHTAGIRVLVVTGDHPLTAAEIARRVGIGAGGLTTVNAGDLEHTSEAELDRLLAGDREIVFARSSPETKMRVTDALQDAGHVVAMTGDGVNDAPALRRADIGVAMGRSGTDVAREAATMVLTDDDFSTIVTAVRAGRRVYDNVRKFVLYIFAHATPEVVPFLVFALSGGRIPLPLTVLQILCIDIGTETLPALALGREPAEPSIMDRPPRPRSERLIGGRLLLRAWLLLGGVSAVLVLGIYLAVLHVAGWTPGAAVGPGSSLEHAYLQATTAVFLGIVACQIGTAFAARTDRASLRSVGLLSNRLLLGGIAFELVFAAAVVTLPGVHEALGMELPPEWALAAMLAFPLLVWGPDEAVRAVTRRRHTAPAPRPGDATGDATGAEPGPYRVSEPEPRDPVATAALPASSRATGTRKGEHET